ncbi:hypothetical protein [Allokutzneria sp. NRRL B-24872]|uniref:hypothetical protein n=1 Tax=Allokutzneria sp. NRRL B-24872 TaxID=1137961 RepID=UPI000A3C88D9|nr:hypothetical protein [Allokutzneria sp. NRRL B-24872]
MASLEQLPQEVRDRLREYGVEDLSVFQQQAATTEALLAVVEEQVTALRQEAEAVSTRIEYLLSVLPQYAGGAL